MKHPNPKAVMARAFSLIFISIYFSSAVFSQTSQRVGKIAQRVESLKKQGLFVQAIPLFRASLSVEKDPGISSVLKKYSLIETEGIEAIQQTKPEYLSFDIPIEDGNRSFKVLLYKENISSNGFTLKTEKGVAGGDQDIANYRGMIDDDPASLVALSFANNELYGYISNHEGNYVIGRSGNSETRHIIYNDADIINQVPFECATNTFIPESPVSIARPGELAAVTNKCVNWYWETDYDLFVNKGSLANVTAYMQSVFNQMATLYANDGITVTLKTLFVWTTEDPYTGHKYKRLS